MSLLELLRRRRSCRKFSEKEVAQSVIENIIEGVMTAPSSKNTRSTRLAVVRDRTVIESLGKTRTFGSSFLSEAPAVIVVMGDESAGDLWRENCSISATILQLLAEDMGVGSCWVHINDRLHNDDKPEEESAEDYIKRLIPQCAPYRIECMVAIGYPAAPPKPRKDTDDSDKWFEV